MTITNDIIESNLFCNYKSYLKLKGINGEKNEYEEFYSEEKEKFKTSYLQKIEEIKLKNDDSKNEFHYLLNQQIKFEKFAIDFFAIEKGIKKPNEKGNPIIPIFLIPSDKVMLSDRLLIACLCQTLKGTKYGLPKLAKIVYGSSFQTIKFSTNSYYNKAERLVSNISEVEPPLILNNHCEICEFKKTCREKAIREDNLSLLDRVTPKIIEKYKKKGLFTIQQLSFIYKPRKKRKQRSAQAWTHNNELQALALKTKKIYIQQLPELSKNQTEIYVDFEGIPNRGLYYLIGLIIIEHEDSQSYSLWADNEKNESEIWSEFNTILNKYADSPIYHYGNYESKAIDVLAKRYSTDTTVLKKRLVNLNTFIYGKIYFPTYSNRLKDIGNYLDFKWTSNELSGIQSVIWRLRWEENKDEGYKSKLKTYNNEDCKVLISLKECLLKINENSNSLQEVDFADKPKQLITDNSNEIYKQFGNILKFAHNDYDIKKITFQNINENEKLEKKKRGVGHKGVTRVTQKAKRIINVSNRLKCPKHQTDLILTNEKSEYSITDFIFSKYSIRKTIIKYSGFKSYCSLCDKSYLPPKIQEIRGYFFGHNYKCWIVYQRLFLRLPMRIIQINLKALFNEDISKASVSNVIMSFSEFYEKTNEEHLKKILESPFVHVDETKINVRDEKHYVWIFTDGKYVYLKKTETRETTIVSEILKNYKGILVADFYPGFESIVCKHQKCWVHLIRDMNEDLRKNPFDKEYEIFVTDLRNLIIPIFETIKKYGSKKRHFNKFQQEKEKFYQRKIIGKTYHSELSIKYQTRIKKNWVALFTFLEYDNIPWNNNTAERGLRHIAIQRKISTFFSNGINQYLVFLGIMQTYIFQNKSFLNFLLSKKTSIQD